MVRLTPQIVKAGVLVYFSRAVSSQTYCEPCSNGEEPSQDDDCSELVDQAQNMMATTPECAQLQLALFQQECCTVPPRARCTLCPDGRSFDGSKVVPNFQPHAADNSCADLTADNAFLDFLFESGTCEDTLLRRSAAWCGCPGVERQCSLCPNGERPPNPTLVDPVYYGWDCDTFDYMSSYFTESECADMVDSIFEFDAPSYCGCKDSPIPNVCDLCPRGHILANPELELGHNSRFTCRDLALSTRYIPSVEPCEHVLETHRSNGYIRACCAPVEMVPKKYGGTASAPRTHGVIATLVAVIASGLWALWGL